MIPFGGWRSGFNVTLIVFTAAVSSCSSEDAPTAPSWTGPPQIIAARISPFVLDPARVDTVRVEAFVLGEPARVEFVLENQRSNVPMQRGDKVMLPMVTGAEQGTLWTAAVSSRDLLVFPRVVGMQALIGGPMVVDSSGKQTFFPLNAWIRAPVVPPVAITNLAADAQVSAHVFNVRDDELATAFGGVREAIPIQRFRAWARDVRRFFDYFADDFDYVAILPPLRFADGAGGEHLGYRNTTTGIGQDEFDYGATVPMGSAGRLQSFVYYADPIGADFAASTFSHELAHRWMVRLSTREFANSAPHWPISDLAIGIMGFGVRGNSGRFPYDIEQVSDGRYRLRRRLQSQVFNSMELYLMGLLPRTDVTESYRVFDGGFPTPADGVEFFGVARSFTIDSLIAMVGVRKPDAAVSPKRFRLGTVVISRGRLLTSTEMAMLDFLVARGEAQTPLLQVSESADVNLPTAFPFFVATGQRASITTAFIR